MRGGGGGGGGDVLPPSRAASWIANLVLVSIMRSFEEREVKRRKECGKWELASGKLTADELPRRGNTAT